MTTKTEKAVETNAFSALGDALESAAEKFEEGSAVARQSAIGSEAWSLENVSAGFGGQVHCFAGCVLNGLGCTFPANVPGNRAVPEVL